jgi:hypothetical protein
VRDETRTEGGLAILGWITDLIIEEMVMPGKVLRALGDDGSGEECDPLFPGSGVLLDLAGE